MTTSLVAEALKQAHQPAAVIPGNVSRPVPTYLPHFIPDDRQKDAGVYAEILEFALKANALRSHALQQTARAVSVLAGFDNLNWAKLKGSAPGAAPRKPRVKLWADSNQRDTLEVFWLPILDDTAEYSMPETGFSLCKKSDYSEFDSTWPYVGASKNVVLRFLAREYVYDTVPIGGRKHTIDGKELLKTALVDALAELLNALSAVCDISVEDWPEYGEDGHLQFVSAETRARRTLAVTLAKLNDQKAKLNLKIQQKLDKLGLSSVAEFEELREQAEKTDTKVTALIFAKTGTRVTSHTTNPMESFLEEFRICERNCMEVEAALAER